MLVCLDLERICLLFKFCTMTGYFFIGFVGGIALSFIVIAGMLHKLQNEASLFRKTIDRLERYNSLLQHKLHNTDRHIKEVTEEAPAYSN